MQILDVPTRARTRVLPWAPIKLCPLGDIQAGIDACDLDLLSHAVERGLRENAYFIGMGDYLDQMSPSNRKALAAANFYDSVLDAMQEKMAEEMAALLRILEPTRGRWLGLLEGHHTFEFYDGTTTDTRICAALDAPFLGHCAMLRLTFTAGKRTVNCVIWAHHGVGSGNTLAAPLTKLEKVLEWAEADLYLMGHQHKRVAAAVPRFYLVGDTPLLVARERLCVGTGS